LARQDSRARTPPELLQGLERSEEFPISVDLPIQDIREHLAKSAADPRELPPHFDHPLDDLGRLIVDQVTQDSSEPLFLVAQLVPPRQDPQLRAALRGGNQAVPVKGWGTGNGRAPRTEGPESPYG